MQTPGKISFILPFFGEPPDWLPCFLQSCESNDDYEWFLFTDFSPPGTLPLNVRWQQSSLDEIRAMASEKLLLDIPLRHAYKLTDLKPAYGLIFSDYLSHSSHWGYCDLDLVWGQFSRFIDQQQLAYFDIISGGKDFLPGHMMILQNKSSNNHLFRQTLNWQQIFTDPRCFSFDEIIRQKPFLPDEQSIRNAIASDVRRHLKKMIQRKSRLPRPAGSVTARLKQILQRPIGLDFNTVIRQGQAKGTLKVLHLDSYSDDVFLLAAGRKEFELTWNEGILMEAERELLYYHFQLSKYENGFELEQINDTGFRLKGQLRIP